MKSTDKLREIQKQEVDVSDKCENCTHWKATTFYNYKGVENDGVCDEIKTHIDIEVVAGWSGGYVGQIETGSRFCCAEFKGK